MAYGVNLENHFGTDVFGYYKTLPQVINLGFNKGCNEYSGSNSSITKQRKNYSAT